MPISQAVGCVLAHDITEIRKGEFKGAAFRKGHIVTENDIPHLERLGKEHLYVLNIADDEMHEDEAAWEIASILKGDGITVKGEPKEGKINLIAARDGLLKINTQALLEFNMLGDLMCSTLHNNTMVENGQTVAGARAIPLVIKRELMAKASTSINTYSNGKGIIDVKELRKFRAGIVITGNEVFYGKIKDTFAPVITDKLRAFEGEIVNIIYAPDDADTIERRLKGLIEEGADLLIVTGGMSVDPDDVSRFAISKVAQDVTYGSAVLPGAMFLVAYYQKTDVRHQTSDNRLFNTAKEISDTEKLKSSRPTVHQLLKDDNSSNIPIVGVPACGMYHKTTVFDLVLPRILTGENIGRKELAELGHGGLCLNCRECRHPVCPFGK
jgi:hypothetical protein